MHYCIAYFISDFVATDQIPSRHSRLTGEVDGGASRVRPWRMVAERSQVMVAEGKRSKAMARGRAESSDGGGGRAESGDGGGGQAR